MASATGFASSQIGGFATNLAPTWVDTATDPRFRERFRREAHAAANLREPHIVPIHHYGEIGGRLYVDMRLIDGTDLHALLATSGPMKPELAVSIVDQVAAALDAAHACGVVHRDIKPANILVGARNFVYLIDFGIAHASGNSPLTETGSTMGTFTYMAPERFTTGSASAQSDVYALTCVLHECLTGALPFPGVSLEQQVSGHLTAPPPRPSVIRPGVPIRLDAVIARGMAKNPEDRYRTAGELAAAARDVVAAGPDIEQATVELAAAPVARTMVLNSRTATTAIAEPKFVQPPAAAMEHGVPRHRPLKTPRRARTVWTACLLAVAMALVIVGAVYLLTEPEPSPTSGPRSTTTTTTVTTTPTPSPTSTTPYDYYDVQPPTVPEYGDTIDPYDTTDPYYQ